MLAPAWKPQLYNLAADLGETRDVAAQNTALTRELHGNWQTWNRTLPPPARKPAAK